MSLLHTRFLTPSDISALCELERTKWATYQAASADTMAQRIFRHPELCVGAFCACSGKAHASLFLQPVQPAMFTGPVKWIESWASTTLATDGSSRTRSLFGISLSSINAGAVKSIFAFLYPHLLKQGWRDIYLGSPIPGLRRALSQRPDMTVWQYVHAKRGKGRAVPLDHQLHYYYKKGFREIVSIQKDYFPHHASLDYGVILRGKIPLSRPAPLWQAVPLPLLKGMSKVLFH